MSAVVLRKLPMLEKLLTHYADLLNEFLKQTYKHPEGIAAVGRIGGTTDAIPNKLVISLLNVEREAAGGSAPSTYRSDGGSYTRTYSPLLLNLNVILASVFEETRYDFSLSVLSDALRFVQACPKFKLDGMDFTVEILGISMQDFNNVWTLLGGQCYPSVLCRIRYLHVDGGVIASSGKTFNNPDVNVNGGN